MKTKVINNVGNPYIFETAEKPYPKLKPGYIIIKVKSTSVNPIDAQIRSGALQKYIKSFPSVLHSDVSGVIVEVGVGVDSFKVGDEVYGCVGYCDDIGGALSEFVLADPQLLAKKPENLTRNEASALPLVTITAWESLYNRINVKNKSVLIHAATGGVRHIAIQLAKIAKAKVFATTSSQEKIKIGKFLGADIVINYTENSVEEYVNKYTNREGFDIVFDTVGGDNLYKSFQAAKNYGTVSTIQSFSKYDLSLFNSKSLTLNSISVLLKIRNKNLRRDYGLILRKVTELVEKGCIYPLVNTEKFSFDRISDAHALLDSKRKVGKIIVENLW